LAASLLLAGQIMQATSVVPFYLALAHGHTKMIVRMQLLGLALIAPLLIVLVGKFGVVGAGIAWLAMNVFTLCPFMYFLHRRFLRGELESWVRHDIGQPLLAALATALLCHWILPQPSSRILSAAEIVLVWGMAFAASVMSVAEFRDLVSQKTRQLLLASYAS
jgi:O-antigen/teichoic acid export membrane protein